MHHTVRGTYGTPEAGTRTAVRAVCGASLGQAALRLRYVQHSASEAGARHVAHAYNTEAPGMYVSAQAAASKVLRRRLPRSRLAHMS